MRLENSCNKFNFLEARNVLLLLITLPLFCLGACSGTANNQEPLDTPNITAAEEEKTEDKQMDKLKMMINETEVAVSWENNESVAALIELVKEKPLVVQMSMYGGFEQVGSLGSDIVRDDRQITTNPGDIVLYSGDQIVVFYGSNSWAYTKLGHMDLAAEMLSELLGQGDVVITLS